MPKNPDDESASAFKGKRVVFADADRVDSHRQIANEVMLELFEFQPDEYLITDESSLFDFVGLHEDAEEALSSIWQRIEQSFGINKDDVASNNLASIFEAVDRRRNIQ